MFNLQQLAQLKAQAVQDQRNGGPSGPADLGVGAGTVEVQTPGFGTNPVHEPNLPGGEGFVFEPKLPNSGAATSPPPSGRPDGVSSYVWDKVQRGTLDGLNPALITHGDGATRDALVAAGYGDYVKSAYEKAMDQRAEHYGGNGSQSAMENAQLGWYNDRHGTYGGQQPPEQVGVSAIPSPAPVAPAGFSNAGSMFNALAGATNTVRGINGTQPTYQPGPTGMPPNKQQPPSENPNWGQQPQWSPVVNSATAAGPPGHGGGNPGFGGMLTNTDATMAALKALAQRFRK